MSAPRFLRVRMPRVVGPRSAPADAASLRREGNDAFKRGDYDLACACYTGALDLWLPPADRAICLTNRAAARLKSTDPAAHHRALADAERATSLDASNFKAHLRHGQALRILGHDVDAILALRKASALDAAAEAELNLALREVQRSPASAATLREVDAKAALARSVAATAAASVVNDLTELEEAEADGASLPELEEVEADGASLPELEEVEADGASLPELEQVAGAEKTSSPLPHLDGVTVQSALPGSDTVPQTATQDPSPVPSAVEPVPPAVEPVPTVVEPVPSDVEHRYAKAREAASAVTTHAPMGEMTAEELQRRADAAAAIAASAKDRAADMASVASAAARAAAKAHAEALEAEAAAARAREQAEAAWLLQRSQAPSSASSAAAAAGAEGTADGTASAAEDKALIERLLSLGLDWGASPARMRSLLQQSGMHGISEKRLKKLKASRLQLENRAPVAAEAAPALIEPVSGGASHPPASGVSKESGVGEASGAALVPAGGCAVGSQVGGKARKKIAEGAKKAAGGSRGVWGPGVEVRPGRGRCAIALDSLPAGTVVDSFSGKPYGSCLLPGLQSRFCEACCREGGELSKPLRACPGCGFSHYCSKRCREADAERHSCECDALHSVADPTSPLGALRAECEPSNIGRFGGLLMAVRSLWRRHNRGQREKSAGEDEAPSESRLPGRSGADEALHDRLFDHMAQGPISSDDRALGRLAAKVPSFLPPGVGADRVAALLGALRVNMISVASRRHVQHSPTVGDEPIIGVGCYPQTALLNHSCAPNCVLAYPGGGTLEVRTTRPVAKGEELCHSYTDLCTPTRLRQTALHNRYGFVCDCPRCSGVTFDGDDVDFLMEAVLGDDDGDGVGGGGGGGGGGADPLDEVIRLSEAQLARAEQVDDLRIATQLTQKALVTRRRVCHPLSMLRYHAESAAFDLAVRAGDKATARECCRNVLAFYEMSLSHVPWHPAIALERYQLAELESALGERPRARTQLDRCVAALMVTHGKAHPLTERAVASRSRLR